MKSILLHIYADSGLNSRLQAALDLARAFGGHITCLQATPFEDYLTADPLLVAVLPVQFSQKMEKRRLDFQARVEEGLKDEGVTWDCGESRDAWGKSKPLPAPARTRP